jgi:hypothetical protein
VFRNVGNMENISKSKRRYISIDSVGDLFSNAMS